MPSPDGRLPRMRRRRRGGGASRLAVVIGPQMDGCAARSPNLAPMPSSSSRPSRLGTAHAVLAAAAAQSRARWRCHRPLWRHAAAAARNAARVCARRWTTGRRSPCSASRPPIPPAMGVCCSTRPARCAAIREEKRGERSRKARSTYAIPASWPSARASLLPLLRRIGNANAKGEYYLTDAVEIARSDGLRVAVVTCPEDEVMGVNDRVQLARAESLMQKRLREAAMRSGATLLAPETVTFSHDTRLGQRRHRRAERVLRPERRRRQQRRDQGQLLYGAGPRSRKAPVIGPFARLRPGAEIGARPRSAISSRSRRR